MEIKINIPANDFVQPTEVREEIVQKFCDHVIQYMDKGATKNGYSISILDNDHKAEVYLNFRFNGSVSGISCCKNELVESCGGESVKLRTVEMQAIFDAMQKAGYFIFGSYCTNGTHYYNFNRRSYFSGRHATHMEFNIPID